MRCLSCQFENPPAMKFCGQCGTQLAQLCPRCGAENQPTFKFCGQCGTALTAPSPPGADTAGDSAQLSRPPEAKRQGYTPPHLAEKILRSRSALEGERRQVTVLFADMAGFTTLAEKLDPEEVHQIIDRCFELITAEVHRFEGTINQYTGDGVMALFGAPVAHEDSPRRAVHAALGMQRALRAYGEELQAQRGLALQMRLGLNTGLVVVGKIGDDLRMDYTAVGDTTNLAARLQQMARPGSVLVSEATHRAVGGFFETLDLGEMPVKGHTPVRAFEVLRPRGRRMRFDVAVERGLTPLVGRERELGLLLDRFSEVKAGRGQVVFITGEAGIGKSRLVLECRRALAAAGDTVTWLEGRCISFGESIPFLPIIDQLRENFGIQEFDGEPEIIAKIEHGMRRMGEVEAHIPAMRYLLSVDPGDPAFAAMEAVARRRKIFDAVRALTLRGARLRPLVLVVEDLHWIDTSSEEFLSSLMDAVAAVPLLLILTYRVEYTPPFGSRSFYTTLTLHSLSEAETVAMASRVLGTAQFPQELHTALMEKAEGVPLFIEEVTKTLLDLGVLERENGNYRLVKSLAEVSVPDTIQGIIMARLDRLGEDGKRTVQLASVIGRQFLVRLLERIAGLTGQLEGLLQELKTLEIIYELGLLPEPAYIFKHAVIQDVAYHSLLVQRRKELHRAVGYAIEELYPDRLANHYEELAHHFVQGEAWEKAFDYLVLAGDKAKNAYANQTALDFYARALAVAPRVVPSMPARRITEIYQRRGQVYMLLSRYPEAIAKRSACSRTRVRRGIGRARARRSLIWRSITGRRSRGTTFRRRRDWAKRRWVLPKKPVTSGWWRGVLFTLVQWTRCMGNCWRENQSSNEPCVSVRREVSRMSSRMPLGCLELRRTGVESFRGRLPSVSRGNERQQTGTTVPLNCGTRLSVASPTSGWENTPRPSRRSTTASPRRGTGTTRSSWGGLPTPWAGCTRNWAISSAPPSTTATALTLASALGIPMSRSAP